MQGTNPIVTVDVFLLQAPAPNTLQQTGAIISQGATTLAAGTYSLLTNAPSLTSILTAAEAVTSIAWASGTATVTAAAPHNVPIGSTFITTIAGATTVAYNGTYLATATGASTFTYPLASDGGTTPATGSITYTPYNQGEVSAAVNTFFAQGNAVSVYILELGAGTPAAGVTALTTYLAAPSLQFYRYLLPADWGATASAYQLANQYSSFTSQVYFHPTLTLSNYTSWLNYKSVVATVQSPSAALTELDSAILFYQMLANAPSSTNLLGPTAFRYAFGVTAYNPSSSVANTLKTNYLNYIDTGAEGGLTNTIVKFGTDMSGLDCSFWYAVDWMNIQEHEALASAVIQGSNTQPPLYYNQAGVNTLQAVAQGVANQAVSYGVASGAPVVTAVPFSTYTAANPSNYIAGIYNGLALTFTPATGFKSITFNLTASELAAAG